MTTNTTTKPSVSFTSQNGAKVEAFLILNERYNREYQVRVNGTIISSLSNRGRGRYAWPAFDVHSNGQSFLGNLEDAVHSIVSGATNYHVEGCQADIHNQPQDDIDWDRKCDCGLASAAVQAAKASNDPRRARERKAEREAKIQDVKDARKAIYPEVRAALVAALGITADEDDDPTVDDDGLVWLYHGDTQLNDDAVDFNKVKISFTDLAKILGVEVR